MDQFFASRWTVLLWVAVFWMSAGCGSDGSTANDDTESETTNGTDGDVDTDSDSDSDTDTDSDSDTDTDTDTDSDPEPRGDLPIIAGCTVFAADDEWNRDISNEPVDAVWTAENPRSRSAFYHENPNRDGWESQAMQTPAEMERGADAQILVPAYKSLRKSLRQFLRQSMTAITDGAGVHLRFLMARAQQNEAFRERFRDNFVAKRRAVLKSIFIQAIECGQIRSEHNLELLLDIVFGAMWYPVTIPWTSPLQMS